jgi:hypothetical protein
MCYNPAVTPATPEKPKGQGRKAFWLIVAALAIIVFGNFHVVSSSTGYTMVRRTHFGFSEMFVSLDAITGMPFIQAKGQYPLAVKALQREGLLESDESFNARIESDVKRQMEEGQREAERMMREAGL